MKILKFNPINIQGNLDQSIVFLPLKKILYFIEEADHTKIMMHYSEDGASAIKTFLKFKDLIETMEEI